MPDELKKNDVHIKAVKNIQAQIEKVATLARRPKANAVDVKAEIIPIRTEVSTTFNNREMALVNTKLQEAEHWCNEGNVREAAKKLTEAKGWAGEYVVVLE